jgi:Cu(I)/Ag(I) efflux system membrane fusion protein
MVTRILGLLALNIILFSTAAYVYLVNSGAPMAQGGYRWEAVDAEVTEGPGQTISVRLVGPDGKPVANPKIDKLRLDMAPDDMAAMDTPLEPLPAQADGTLAYKADLTMAGRWALHIESSLPGVNAPIKGEVVFTAAKVEKTAKPADPSRKIAYYRNPMGLPDTSPVPKKDEMGMDYIAVYEDEIAVPPGTTRIEEVKLARARVKTEIVARIPMNDMIRVAGSVVPDESRIAVVSTRFDGFIDELYQPVTGATVTAGTPLARIWIESPEILERQSAFAALLKASKGKTTAEIQAAEQGLKLFGLPAEAIASLKETREPVRSFVLRAESSGTITEKTAIRGMRFRSGDMLFKTIDLSSLWVMANVPERDIGLVRQGQDVRVSLNAYPGEVFRGKVLFINREIDAATRTAAVRIALANPKDVIKINLLAIVEIETDEREVIAVPRAAVLDSGQQQVAVVWREDGLFESRIITCGRSNSEYTEVLSGLKEGEKVVVNGNFLIDSESNLKAALNALTAQDASK